jgi:hypothetical protein
MDTKDYILLIANSYFDALNAVGNDKKNDEMVVAFFNVSIFRAYKIQERDNFGIKSEFILRFNRAIILLCYYIQKFFISNEENEKYAQNREYLERYNIYTEPLELYTENELITINIAMTDELVDALNKGAQKPLIDIDLDILTKCFLCFMKNNPIDDETQTRKHENIFCDNGFLLFDHILNEYVKVNRGRLSDIHFFYWSMYNNKPQLIHQRPERFKEWFLENYDKDLGKIKTYDDLYNADRQKHYSNALDWFKLQNK